MQERIFRAQTLEEAVRLFFEILSTDEDVEFDLESIQFGEWATRSVYLHDGHSSINPPFMEAYLDLQKEIYQIAAIAKTGGIDATRLSNIEKELFQINVVVTNGSSDISANLGKIFTELGKYMIDKLDGKQIVILVLGSAILYCGHTSFSAFLQFRKETLLQEAASQEKRELLNKLNFANHEQVELLKKIFDALNKQGAIGKHVSESTESNNDAFLKAAGRVERSKINTQEITKEEANLLRSHTNLPIKTKFVTQEMIVYYANTGKPEEINFGLSEPYGNSKYRILFKDDLFNHIDKVHLMTSLENRTPLWVELLIKETEEEVKSVQLLRVVDPPTTITPPSTNTTK